MTIDIRTFDALAVKGIAAVSSSSAVLACLNGLPHPYNAIAATALTAAGTFINWASTHRTPATGKERQMSDQIKATVNVAGHPVETLTLPIPDKVDEFVQFAERLTGTKPSITVTVEVVPVPETPAEPAS